MKAGSIFRTGRPRNCWQPTSRRGLAIRWLRPFPNVSWLSFLDIIPSWGWFLLKSFFFLYVFIWVRATLPRYRYDQLMRLGWKVFLPFSLIWVFLVSGYLMLTRYS